jgi:4a-hydroxytetrahydrobiopterin dehydratase
MNLAEQNCLPCAGGVPPFTRKEAWERLTALPGWELADDGKRIERNFKFHNFEEAWKFATRVATLAETQGHHPDINFGWGYCKVSLQTHAINGLHDNDFIMAAKIDEISHQPEVAESLR